MKQVGLDRLQVNGYTQLDGGAVIGTPFRVTDASLLDSPALVFLPRGTLAGGYAQAVVAQSGITTIVDVTGLSVTVTVSPNRRLKVTGYFAVQSTVADDIAASTLNLDGSSLGIAFVNCGAPGANQTDLVNIQILTLAAGTHTLKLQANRAVGTGSLTIQNSFIPGFILVEDIGV